MNNQFMCILASAVGKETCFEDINSKYDSGRWGDSTAGIQVGKFKRKGRYH